MRPPYPSRPVRGHTAPSAAALAAPPRSGGVRGGLPWRPDGPGRSSGRGPRGGPDAERATRRPAAAFVFGLGGLLLAFAGCGPNWLEHRDDPYLSEAAVDGDRRALAQLNSPREADRIVAVRLLAEASARERAAGRVREAEQYAGFVRKRFAEDRSDAVKSDIVALAAPVMGVDSPATWTFLRQRIAEGRFAGEAALSLAALGPPEAFEAIAPLTAHPLPATRYAAALALTILADPRGAAAARRVAADMSPERGWPPEVRGMPLADAQAALRARIDGAFHDYSVLSLDVYGRAAKEGNPDSVFPR